MSKPTDLQRQRAYLAHKETHTPSIDLLCQTMTATDLEARIRMLDDNMRSRLRETMTKEERMRSAADVMSARNAYEKALKRLTT